jgi:hypothetical protein
MDADGRPLKKKASPWLYVGCGCAVLVFLGFALITGLTYMGYRGAKRMETNFKDPKAREASTRDVLPYRELPAGYYPWGAFSIPFVMEMAFFGDQQPQAGKGPQDNAFREHGFIFFKMPHLRGNKEDMERYLRGEQSDRKPRWMQGDVDFRAEANIRRGTVNVGGAPVLWATNRGDIRQKGERKPGIVTMVMPQCPGGGAVRFGLWFNPDPAPGKPIPEVDWAGTSADPAQVQSFLGHFQLCPK